MPRKPPSRKGTIPWNKGRTDLPKKPLSKARRERAAILEERAQQHVPVVNSRVALAMLNPYKVEIGQVWFNVDERAGVNTKAGPVAVKVANVEPPYATCYWTDREGKFDERGNLRVSRIRLDRFRAQEARKTRWGGGNRGWRLKP